MKNRFFVGLAFFSLVSMGGLVVASELHLVIFNHPVKDGDIVNQEYRGPFLTDIPLNKMLKDQKNKIEELGVQNSSLSQEYFLTKIEGQSSRNGDFFSFSSIIRRRGMESGYAGHIALPKDVLCNPNGSFKTEVILNGCVLPVQVLNEEPISGFSPIKLMQELPEVGGADGGNEVDNSSQQPKAVDTKSGYSFIKPFAGFSLVFVGFIYWAHRNNVSFQDMQEAFGTFFSKYNVAK